MTTPAQQNMRLAMEILTAWNEGGDNTDLAGDIVMGYVRDADGDVVAEAAVFLEMVLGMTSLAGRLLVRLEKATGQSTTEILRNLGQRIAEDR